MTAGAVGALLALVLAGSAALLFQGSAHAADTSVSMVDFAFEPADITINVGDSVTWTNNGVAPHTATADDSSWDSGTLHTGETFTRTFDTAGTFTYHCSIHPNMVGTIVVEEVPATSTSTSTVTTTATASPTTATATPTTATATPPTTTATPPSTQAPTTPIAGGATLALTGAEEIPPVTNPMATGQFQYRLDGNTLVWRLTATGQGLTMAHLHLAPKGDAGPIVVTLFPMNPAGVSNIDVSGSVAVSNLEGPLAGNLDQFLADLAAGNIYVNVHSLTYPGGALRAQIPAATAATPTSTSTATAPNPPSAGSGIEGGSSHTGLFLGLAGVGVVLAATGGAAAVALRRRA